MPASIGAANQTDAVADVASYTAHASGATPVTSNAATDLDTTAAQVALLTTKVNELLAAMRAAKLIAN